MKTRCRMLFKIEIWKAIHNIYFWISCCFGVMCAFLSGNYMIKKYLQLKESMKIISGNPMWGMASLYNYWIGGESQSIGYALFFFLLPILATIPFSWSYCDERKNGYAKLPILLVGRKKYFWMKCSVIFLMGGSTIIIPQILNIVFVSCFVPAYRPSVVYMLYYPIQHGSLWSEMFYTKPFIFILCYLMLDYIFGGLFAVIAYALSFYTKNKIAVIILPYIMVLVVHYCRTFLQYKVYKEISPLHFLHSLCIENRADACIIIVEMLILIIGSVMIIIHKRKRYEDL